MSIFLGVDFLDQIAYPCIMKLLAILEGVLKFDLCLGDGQGLSSPDTVLVTRMIKAACKLALGSSFRSQRLSSVPFSANDI
ncbi:MAG TPA: hypothetical protein VJ952_14060 [Opitutales bacterium]|nr:hypothetical protein [Opitutales bacterium]